MKKKSAKTLPEPAQKPAKPKRKAAPSVTKLRRALSFKRSKKTGTNPHTSG